MLNKGDSKMKKRIKLRDLTPEQWDNFIKKDCLKNMANMDCDNCIFRHINCSYSGVIDSWINHKNLYSKKFLNQAIETEIEVPDILDEKEKEYLSAVIKPFKNRISNISKYKRISDSFEYIVIGLKDAEGFILPRFQENTMYKGMELNKEYSLEELGL
jgi:hypothetical protein